MLKFVSSFRSYPTMLLSGSPPDSHSLRPKSSMATRSHADIIPVFTVDVPFDVSNDDQLSRRATVVYYHPMANKRPTDQEVVVDFESHPPIDSDLDGIATLLRQTFLHFVDCNSLAKYIISLRETTQVIAVEADDDDVADGADANDEDEPDNDIYGVTSIIDLQVGTIKDNQFHNTIKVLSSYLGEKSQVYADLLGNSSNKLILLVNERYINIPAQLSLPILKTLTKQLDESKPSHLVFFSKILITSKDRDRKLPSKRSKSSGQSSKSEDAEPLIFVNPEEEIIFENCVGHTDIDVSSHCDENASWSYHNDTKYIPYRRIMIVDYKKWPSIIANLEKELKH